MISATNLTLSNSNLQGQQLQNSWDQAFYGEHNYPNKELLHHMQRYFKNGNPGQEWTNWVTEKIRGTILEAAKVRDQASVDAFAENNYPNLAPQELIHLYHLLNSHKKDGIKEKMLGNGVLAETLVKSLEDYITEWMVADRPADAQVLVRLLEANPLGEAHHLLPKLQAALLRPGRIEENHPALTPPEEDKEPHKILHEDVLGYIFSFVQEGLAREIRLVCKTWKNVFDTVTLVLLRRRIRNAGLLPDPVPEGKLNYQSIFSTFLHNLQNLGMRQEKPEEMATLEVRKFRRETFSFRLFRVSEAELKELNQTQKDTALIQFCEVLPDAVKDDLLDGNGQIILKDVIISLSEKANLLRQALEKSTKVKQIIELDLNNKGLFVLPPEISKFKALQRLNLNNNQIREIPPEIGQLIALQQLSLSDNQIKELPPAIGQLIALTYLNLSNNQIRKLPSEFGQLIALGMLFLEYNQIREVPSQISALKKLNYLDLSHNQIKELPSSISELTALKTFNLRNNPFTGELPPEILAIIDGMDS